MRPSKPAFLAVKWLQKKYAYSKVCIQHGCLHCRVTVWIFDQIWFLHNQFFHLLAHTPRAWLRKIPSEQPTRCRNAQHLAAHLVYPPCCIGLGVQCIHPLPLWVMLWRPTSKNMAAHHNQAVEASDDALISPKLCKKGCKKKPYHLQSP
jgi:hypothetical protein